MSEVVGEGVIRITTDESGVDVDGAGKRAGEGYTKGFSSSLKGIGAAIGGVLVAGKALDFVKGGIADAREAQKLTAATGAIIKATGGAANLTADQIGDLSSALSVKNGVDDAAIQRGANLLLTFKNVKKEGEGLNDVFGRATQAGIDLAAAGFGSVEGNALQLGKALNDPLKGISALGRSGVTFTAQQKEQIAGFVEANDLLSAQKIILGEVEAQVGGTGEATATNGEKAALAFGELQEAVGAKLLPVIDRLAGVFVDSVAPAINDVLEGTSALTPVFDAVGSAIGSAFSIFDGGGGAGATGFFTTLQSVAAAVLPQVQSAFAQLAPVVESVFGALSAAAADVLPVVQDTLVNSLLPALQGLIGYVVANVVPVFVQVGQIIATQVVPLIAELATYFYGTLYPAVIAIVTVVATKLRPVFDQLIRTFTTQVLPTIQRLIVQVRTQLIPALLPIISVVVKVVGFLAKLAATILSVVLPPLLKLAGFIFSRVLPAVVGIVTKVAQVISFLIKLGSAIGSAIGKLVAFQTGMVRLVQQGIDAVVRAISALPGKVLGFVSKLVGAGRELISGLLEGMGNAAKGVGGFVAGLASDVGSAVLDAVKGSINAVIDAANNAFPNKISLPGPAPDINLPDNPIPRLQNGTDYTAGGYYNVGEVGQERVYLPQGAKVLSAAKTRQADRQAAAGQLIDYAALAAALADVLGQARPVQFMLPTGDPEAAAMATINRLATL